jgi:hypothetical protein
MGHEAKGLQQRARDKQKRERDGRHAPAGLAQVSRALEALKQLEVVARVLARVNPPEAFSPSASVGRPVEVPNGKCVVGVRDGKRGARQQRNQQAQDGATGMHYLQ